MQTIPARDVARTTSSNEQEPKKVLRGERCKCPACGEYLNSTGMFDRHRVGKYPDRRCLTSAEMLDRGFSKNAAGFWIRSERSYSLAPRAQERRSASTPAHESSQVHA
jgi:hypothetical protein